MYPTIIIIDSAQMLHCSRSSSESVSGHHWMTPQLSYLLPGDARSHDAKRE